jgi:integrase
MRYVCFISEEHHHTALTTLMRSLQQYWGGRYTPIILVPTPASLLATWPYLGTRNRRLKVLGKAAGLERGFVEVIFAGKNRSEQVYPLWQVLTTHTARHTGAGLLVLGSEGDQILKKIALGHVSASVYGYDTLERYGPRLLDAWEVGLGPLPVLAGPAPEQRKTTKDRQQSGAAAC